MPADGELCISPPPAPGHHHSSLEFYESDYLDISHKRKQVVLVFLCLGLCHSAQCPQSPPILLHITEFPSFLSQASTILWKKPIIGPQFSSMFGEVSLQS